LKSILYVAAIELIESDGVTKKILAQSRAMKKLGHKVTLVYLDKCSFVIDSGLEKTNKPLVNKMMLLRELKKYICFDDYNVIYCRYPGAKYIPQILFFFYKCSAIKIIEIPTYPFYGEAKDLKGHFSTLVNFIFRPFFKFVFNYVVYMGFSNKNIWGINSIRMLKKSSIIEMIAIARMETWHGYDRVIKGMIDYLDKGGDNVILHIVGYNEPCYSELFELTPEKYRNKIIFHKQLFGEKLNVLYSNCSIGIDALGRHRTGNNFNSSLKSKEFTAIGMPFIKSHIDEDFINCDFVLNIPSDESIIDIKDVIRWYNGLECSCESIKAYAKNNLTWETKLSFIKDLI